MNSTRGLLIVCSHSHFDHIGDPSTFPRETELIVGPGTLAAKLPSWPENPSSTIMKSAIEGRNVREISQEKFTIPMGQFLAFDFFGDGSFYILDVPGHAIGHICGLARTTDNTFIFMGADACHHAGQYRPSKFIPLPREIFLHRGDSAQRLGSLCSVIQQIHPNPTNYRAEKFYSVKVNENGTSVADDPQQAEKSVSGLQEFDSRHNVFIVCAHDRSLIGTIDIFPNYANHWRDRNWKELSRWKFLRDFAVWDLDSA